MADLDSMTDKDCAATCMNKNARRCFIDFNKTKNVMANRVQLIKYFLRGSQPMPTHDIKCQTKNVLADNISFSANKKLRNISDNTLDSKSPKT